jgi:ureidoglycolate lyase
MRAESIEGSVCRLSLQRATPEALAPFGGWLGPHSGIKPLSVDYYAGAVAMSRPVDFSCSGTTEISLTSLRRRPFEVRYLERHFLHTQTFIPLDGKPFVAVLAPPCEGELPDMDAVQAFRFDGSAGLCLGIGTWHEFPFAYDDDTHMVVLLSTQVTKDLRNRSENGIEASGPDLDKKDIVARTGIHIEVDVDPR